MSLKITFEGPKEVDVYDVRELLEEVGSYESLSLRMLQLY